MSFIHLHNHTHYSLLDGLAKIDEIIEKTIAEKQKAAAITDHGVMYGVIEFYQKCKKAGIKPILGVEAYMAPGSRLDKNSKQEKNNHLILLARNNEGYQNLIKLTSIAHLEGYYYKPRIDWEVLEKHAKGLIACSGCVAGEVPRLIIAGKEDLARKKIIDYRQLFGSGNFYLEIQDHPELDHQDLVNEKLIAFSQELDVPLVVTNDVHYLRREDDEAQDILLCLQNKKKKEDTNRMKMLGYGDYSMRDGAEIVEIFKNVPEAVSNTLKIAEKCNVEIELGKIQLPSFEVPKEYDDNSYLEKLCEDGILRIYRKKLDTEFEKKLRTRLKYELGIISRMGFASYFLITADFVSWAREQGIIVGPGRGSAAGSLVCYLVGITKLDPLKYDLIFERFLNPERISMPDIDLDFADTRREEVIRYVEDKYGKDHVAQIITFGTMAARNAVRDVGRVLNHPYEYCDKLAKMIPMFSKINEALESVDEFKEIYDNEDMARQIINYAQRLEGVARHSSTHACGVLITDRPLTDYVSLQYASSSDRTIVSQYSLHPVEDLGLLKMDFLGLKNLSIIESAIRIIKNVHKVDIDIDKLSLDDKKTYELFQKGETTGVFQFESSGMKRYLRELKPSDFEDLISMVALYRPGPMEWIPDYISGKHGKRQVTYLHPKLEAILKKTYGVAIYQEQVMQIARDLAGFTMGEADVLRKAVGKKIIKLLKEQKDKFIKGCIDNKINEKLASDVWAFIEPFAGYGFPRAHAACYALIAYQTAYLKAHYPAEFMAALLTADQQNTDRIALEIEECRNMEIEVSGPDINESFESFTVVNEDNKTSIRFGLQAVKNVGENIAEVIIRERKENGRYQDLFDFLERVTDKDLNKKSLESLIKSGGLDKFGTRAQLLHNIERLLSFNKEVSKARNSRQTSLFGGNPDLEISNRFDLESAPEIDKRERLDWEKELLGLYISEHPFNSYRRELQSAIVSLADLNINIRDSINIAGVISTIKKIITRSNESMLFVKIEDALRAVEVLIFPKLLKENPAIWEEGKVVIINGRVSDKDQEIKFLANEASEVGLDNISSIRDKYKQKISPNFNQAQLRNNPLKIIFRKNLEEAELERLRRVLLEYKGEDKVFFKVRHNDQDNIIETSFRVANEDKLISVLSRDFVDLIRVVA